LRVRRFVAVFFTYLVLKRNMAISQLSGIENMLAQMRAVVDAASMSKVRNESSVSTSGGFAAELQRSLLRVSDMQNASTAQAKAFELGASDISLNDVMIDMQKAGLAFQATLQVRNRLVAAYQEIASMPV
jgi:flagellar hook-basal body complex protein FliE